MSTSGPPRVDYTSKDYASLLAAMLDLAQERLPEWTDRSPNDLGVMLLELFAYMGDTLFYNQDRIAGESFLGTARERRSVLHLLRLIGYELRPPVPSSADLTLLFQSDATGSLTMSEGTQFSTTKQSTGAPINFVYRGPADIVIPDLTLLPLYRLDSKGVLSPFVGATPDASVFRLYRSVPVVQIDAAVSGEILGSSDGSAGQRFKLARAPLVAGSLALTVDEGAPEVWTRVETLLNSGSADPHYVVRRDEDDAAWIELGDNKYGRAPRRGRNNLVASYLVGGGAKGNVPPRAISKLVKLVKPVVNPDPETIKQLKHVLNERAASGGADAEDTRSAAERGPQQYRSMGRAVTKSDFEFHAKSFGVHKVRAHAAGWNRVELVVAPAGGGYPSDTLKRDLITYFDAKRMMTTQVDVRDPQYVDVLITGTITVDPRFFNRQVQRRAVDALRSLWSFENVDFEDTLYISKIYEVIEDLDGVVSVFITTFARADAVSDPATPFIPQNGALQFGPSEIPNLAAITLETSGGRDDG